MDKMVIPEESVNISIGDIYKIEGREYRIFHVSPALIGTVHMDENKCENFDTQLFFEAVRNGDYIKMEYPDETSGIAVPDSEMVKAHKKAEVLNDFIEDMNPSWPSIGIKGRHLNDLTVAAERLGLTEKYVMQLFFSYVRSGCNEMSLVDNRVIRKGRKQRGCVRPVLPEGTQILTKKDQALEYALSVFKERLNVEIAHKLMVLNYYSKTEIERDGNVVREIYRATEDAPSCKVVRNYISKNLGGRTVREYIKGEKEIRNNERPLAGNQQSGVGTIGQVCQVDECEVPVELIDAGHNVIGKPVLYCMFDTKACIIIGAYIGFENNSNEGFADLMISMLEPHNNQTSLVGVTCDDYQFPSQVIPRRIYCDRGSEYMSARMERTMNSLGITLSPVPAATGSLKGGVENVFNRLQKELKKLLRNDGYILADHDGPEKARNEACLTIDDFKAICYRLIIQLNTVSLGDGYDRPLELTENDIPSVPAAIWQYYTKTSLHPLRINDENRMRVLFLLLNDDKNFTISRSGITYKNLRYFIKEDWFLDILKEKDRSKIEIRYHDSNVSRIYVRYNGVISAVPLSQDRDAMRDYEGMSWAMIDDINARSKAIRKKQKVKDESTILTTLAENEKTVAEAEALSEDTVNNTKDIPLARAKAHNRLKNDKDDAANRMLNDLEKPALSSDDENADIDSIDTDSDDTEDTDEFDRLFGDDEKV